ncbi:MAG: class I SAM-dependent methyltransferase [Streptosporangiaceae bacterium]
MGAGGGAGGAAAGLTGSGLTGSGAGGPGLGDVGLGDVGLSAEMRAAYDAAAAAWRAGPQAVYAVLARALVAAAGLPLAGRRVLDLGAGTGVAGTAALAAGARLLVSADLAPVMLRGLRADAHPVAADAQALPFRDGSFDLLVAAFSLGHLPSIAAGLREARRVAGAIAASSFAPGWAHPAQATVDTVLRSYGYRPPGWYVTFKRSVEPQSRDPAALARHAADAGFRHVRLQTVPVDTGIAAPAELASWRLGMAHIAPFVGSLAGPDRARVRRAAESAVAGTGPLVVSMLVLTAS